MDNKLSELSKPVAWTDAEELRDLSKHRCAYMFIIDPANPYHDPRRQQMLYSQEYVSALLSQIEADSEIKARLCRESNSLHDRLKAAEQRIAELEAVEIKPEGLKLMIEAIGAHGYIVGCLVQGRQDLALEESRKWAEAFSQAAEQGNG